MDDVTPSPPSARRFTVVNVSFAVVVVLGLVYILWRGFASESAHRPTPLFGHLSTLEWNGKKQGFMLVSFADLAAVKPGDLMIRHGEVPSRVWEVVSRGADQIVLRNRAGKHVEEQSVSLPVDAATPRFVLLASTGER